MTINLLAALGIPLSQLWLDTPALNATHAQLDIKVYEASALLFDPLPDFSNFVEVPSYINIDAGTFYGDAHVIFMQCGMQKTC